MKQRENIRLVIIKNVLSLFVCVVYPIHFCHSQFSYMA